MHFFVLNCISWEIMADFLRTDSKNILLLLDDEFETNVSKADKVKVIIQATVMMTS